MKDIIEYMQAAEPQEACGFLLRDSSFIGVPNVSETPEDSFVIDPAEWIGRDVAAIVHSHPGGKPYLSTADRENQLETGLPWFVVVGEEIYRYRPVPALRGRKFKYGEADCYTLMRDAYHLAGIDLPDFPRSTVESDADADMFLNNLGKIGFKEVDDLEPGDTLLLDYGYGASHAAIYLGDHFILHHEIGRLSRRDNYSQYMQERIHSIWRHKDWKPERLQGILNDLEMEV